MGNFNLNEYATVDERIHAFYQKFEDGRILTERVTNDPEGKVEIFKSYLYRTPAEQERNLPLSTGYAQEVRDEELQISKQGYEYASVNYTAWLENCETSAIGRALANAGFTGNKNRPSREEMEKVKRTDDKVKGNEPDLQKPSKKSEPKKAKESSVKTAVEDTVKEEIPEDGSDSTDQDILSEIEAFTDQAELITWWKEAGDKGDDFKKQWKPELQKRLQELKEG